ncbi:MAG: alpha/beta hydrolase, partial [Eubacteriales bacterium]|nr:alpha/beta hydrolase [Eubacteriales bacterium]
MYDMTRVNANGYFDSENSEEQRYEKKKAMNALRTEEYIKGEYSRAGGCLPLSVPEDAPFFVKDYSEYYKGRCYHARSLNSNEGWNSLGCQSFMNQPILKYSNEIRSAVLIMHGDKAHSYYFGKEAYEAMVKDSKYTENKELLTIPGAVHTDLYDNLDVIPFERIEKFMKENGVG